MTIYTIFDHGSWQYGPAGPNGVPVLSQVGTGVDWNSYRQNAANFHGGVLVTLSDFNGLTSQAASRDVSMISPSGRLIEVLDYNGTNPQNDLGYGKAVVIQGGSATFTATYTITGSQIIARMSDAELYAAYARDQDQPLRARLTGTATQLIGGAATTGTPQFATRQAAFASLFGATRAAELMAAP